MLTFVQFTHRDENQFVPPSDQPVQTTWGIVLDGALLACLGLPVQRKVRDELLLNADAYVLAEVKGVPKPIIYGEAVLRFCTRYQCSKLLSRWIDHLENQGEIGVTKVASADTTALRAAPAKPKKQGSAVQRAAEKKEVAVEAPSHRVVSSDDLLPNAGQLGVLYRDHLLEMQHARCITQTHRFTAMNLFFERILGIPMPRLAGPTSGETSAAPTQLELPDLYSSAPRQDYARGAPQPLPPAAAPPATTAVPPAGVGFVLSGTVAEAPPEVFVSATSLAYPFGISAKLVGEVMRLLGLFGRATVAGQPSTLYGRWVSLKPTVADKIVADENKPGHQHWQYSQLAERLATPYLRDVAAALVKLKNKKDRAKVVQDALNAALAVNPIHLLNRLPQGELCPSHAQYR